jgi:Pentapeptide repeats (8 copies)
MPWWVVAAAVAIVVIATALWWWLPKRQVNLLRLEIPDAKARADVEDNFRKTIGQLLGGAAVLVGTGFAYYQSQLAQQATYDQLKATYDQIEASKAQIISQQVSKGFEQLGSDKIVVRLGGIYALEGVMNTSKQYHEPVLEALCAFVRDGAKAGIDRDKTKAKGPESPATDIQAALTVIGRREAGPGNIDLIRANLTGANLVHANLTDANLYRAKLTGAMLYRANLTGATLAGGANLTGAMLADANLYRANLTDANLTDANLTDANLYRANLTGADLSGANVTQSQLDKACGDNLLPEHEFREGTRLTIKPC